MMRSALIIILLALSAGVGFSQNADVTKRQAQIANADWIKVGSGWIDGNTISKVSTAVVFNVRLVSEEEETAYFTVVAGCTTDVWSAGNFYRLPKGSKRLVRLAEEVKESIAEPQTNIWSMLEYACTHGKQIKVSKK